MKRSIIALLLILILGLSGCKAQQEASSAIPAERVELDAEAEQKEPLIVPNETEPEEQQPTEGQKEPEEEQPAEEQKEPQEQPAEKEEPEKEGSEIVKFWETVPEMSLDEAKEVMLEKMKRMKSENKLGTLTDEERMALYVVTISHYEEAIARHSSTQMEEVYFTMYLREGFEKDISEYCEAHRWEKQEIAKTYDGDVKIQYDDSTVKNDFDAGFLDYMMDSMYYLSEGSTVGYTVPYSGATFRVVAYPNEDVKENYDHYAKCYKEILRHYISLKSVAFCYGLDLPINAVLD